jgi:VWFA-related protein
MLRLRADSGPALVGPLLAAARHSFVASEQGDSMRLGSTLLLTAALAAAFSFAALAQDASQQKAPQQAAPAPAQNAAQQPAPAPQPADNRIHLAVQVAPKSGPEVPGLTQQDFTVLDNGAPQTIASFHAYTGHDSPVVTLVVIDAVNTSINNVDYGRLELEKFLKSESGELAHPMAIAVLNDTGIQTLGPLSMSGADLNAQLDKAQVALRSLTRSGGFYGAAERSQISLRAIGGITNAMASRSGRKLVIFISPGWPLLSGANVELDGKQEREILDSVAATNYGLMKAGISLYSIDPLGTKDAGLHDVYYKNFLKGITKLSDVHYGALGLQVLAEQSGGLALSENNDVASEIRKCIADGDSYYEISYVPPAATEQNQFHKIEVKVAKPDLVARTRMGYYTRQQ